MARISGGIASRWLRLAGFSVLGLLARRKENDLAPEVRGRSSHFLGGRRHKKFPLSPHSNQMKKSRPRERKDRGAQGFFG